MRRKNKKPKAASNRKASNERVTLPFLQERARRAIALGYQKQRWIEFCETLLADGFSITLYEARRTVSKYVTVSRGDRSFKVRFSNHRPIKSREAAADCDFFVGVCNAVTTNTTQALAAVREFFASEAAQ